jgi:hypothetical protein
MSHSNKLIDPARVRELMAAMQPKVQTKVVPKIDTPIIANAYQMIIKSGCSISDAAQSWKVKVSSIVNYAKENKLPLEVNKHKLDQYAKQIVKSKQFNNIKKGAKTRVAYLLALEYGVSEACRMVKASRRGVYYYCLQYNLPTPIRSIK